MPPTKSSEDNYSNDNPRTDFRSSDPKPNSVYHPTAIRALAGIREDLQKILARVDAAIISEPPAYVAPAVVSSVPVNGTVAQDFADTYATPNENAVSIGRIAIGAVLPLIADASKDGGYTWYRIQSGEHKGQYVRGSALTMQAGA